MTFLLLVSMTLNKHFRSDIISRETFAALTFAQVIAKAQDLKT